MSRRTESGFAGFVGCLIFTVSGLISLAITGLVIWGLVELILFLGRN